MFLKKVLSSSKENTETKKSIKDSKKYIDTVQELEKLAIQNPGCSAALRLLKEDALDYAAAALEQSDNLNLALPLRDLIIDQDPLNGPRYSDRGILLNKLHRYQQAISDCDRAIELMPDLASAYGVRASSYLMLGNLTKAHEDVNQSIKINALAPRAHFVKGCILEQKQQFQESLDTFKHYLTMGHADVHCFQEAEDYIKVLTKRIEYEKEVESKSQDGTQYYDIFLSHYQRTGGQFALALKLLLKEKNPNLNIFLDVDDLENVHSLKFNVKYSSNLLLLLTEGVFERKFVLEELKTALLHNKNIIIVWDKDRCPFPDSTKVDINVRDVLNIKAIIWNSEKVYREVALQQILEKLQFTNKESTTTKSIPIDNFESRVEELFNQFSSSLVARISQVESRVDLILQKLALSENDSTNNIKEQ